MSNKDIYKATKINKKKDCKTIYILNILSSTTVFNNDNNKKCFLSIKSAY